jgi:hypothetical protein
VAQASALVVVLVTSSIVGLGHGGGVPTVGRRWGGWWSGQYVRVKRSKWSKGNTHGHERCFNYRIEAFSCSLDDRNS